MNRKSLQEIKLRGSGADFDESVGSYNLDDSDATRPSQSTLQPPTLPSLSGAESMVKIYFSTVHVAYPFLSRETFEANFPQLWDPTGFQTLSDSWKAILCMALLGLYLI
jgi:hypothetical protein